MQNSKLENDGVLGGFGWVDQLDVRDSKQVLEGLNIGRGRALDVGAGIGRVSKDLLFHIFDKVDLVEQSPKHCAKAQELLANSPQLGVIYNSGLQNFTPTYNYDCIWIQWVLLYLSDSDLIEFLQRCKHGLKDYGVIIVKENILANDAELSFYWDKDDNSITRSHSEFLDLFYLAGLRQSSVVRQKEFPEELFPVNIYVLKSKECLN